MIIDTAQSSPEDNYRILIGSVLPRPIAWVSTVNSDGKTNLAPFSFFTVASANPPFVCFAPGYKGKEVDGKIVAIAKDTLANIRQTGEFVVNIVSQSLAEQMNQSSAEYPPEVDEFELAGVTKVASAMVRPPRVAESSINLECRLHQFVEFGDHPGAGTLVIGAVLCFHLDERVYRQGHIDLDLLEPVGRLSGNFYCTVKDRFEIKRPRLP